MPHDSDDLASSIKNTFVDKSAEATAPELVYSRQV